MGISVIIPIYNVENYIEECLVSVLNQSFKDLEIILVNDGSTDRSITNIEKIINSHNNIKLINKENGGLSSARNEGIRHATEQYISFIDSDDYLDPCFLETLYNEAVRYNLDIVLGGYKRLYSNGKIKVDKRKLQNLESKVSTGGEFLLQQMSHNDYRGEVWDNLYSREFLLKNDLYFIEGIIHEDDEFTPKALVKAQKVKYIQTSGYVYRQRAGSIMTGTKVSYSLDSFLIVIKNTIKLITEEANKDNQLAISKILLYFIEVYETKLLKSNLEDKYDRLVLLNETNFKKYLKTEIGIFSKKNVKYSLLNLSPKLYQKMMSWRGYN